MVALLAVGCLLCGCDLLEGGPLGGDEPPACPHESDEWTVTAEPTCTEKGSKTGFCTVCQENVTVAIDALGHDEVKYPGKEAESCSDTSWKPYFVCKVCDYSSYQEIPPTHNAENQDLTCSKCIAKWGTIEFRKVGSSYEVAGIGTFSGTNLKIPATYRSMPVTSIGEDAFAACASLKSITIPDGVTSIAAHAFRNCDSLVSITIPDSVTSIGENAFESCDSLVSVKIPDGVETISEYLFSACVSLESVTIPDSVKSIGYNAFYNCKSLASLKIPASVQNIGEYAFYACASLESITLPEGIPSIGYYTFYGCTSLKSIVVPASVKSIGDSVFVQCSSLESIVISAGVTSISPTALNNCIGLKVITVEAGNPVYHSSGNCLIETASKTLIAGCQSSVIPGDGSVTSIGYNAFRDCRTLTSLAIPAHVANIETEAFRGCNGLVSLTISTDLVNISDSVFRGCQSLVTAYYEGTSADKKNMTIGSYNSELTAHFYYYSESEPEGKGKFWHYVDGVPTVW